MFRRSTLVHLDIVGNHNWFPLARTVDGPDSFFGWLLLLLHRWYYLPDSRANQRSQYRADPKSHLVLHISRAQQSESSEFALGKLATTAALDDVCTHTRRPSAAVCRNARDVNFKNARPGMATVKSRSLGTQDRKRRVDHQLHPWSNTQQFHWVTHLRWPGSISSAYRSLTHTHTHM